MWGAQCELSYKRCNTEAGSVLAGVRTYGGGKSGEIEEGWIGEQRWEAPTLPKLRR